MAPTSAIFYFTADLNIGRDFIRGVPIYAFHAGGSFQGGWSSTGVSSRGGFEHIMEIVNPQVPVHIAMPRKKALEVFPVNKTVEKINIYAFKPVSGNSSQSGGGYMTGTTIGMSIKLLKVTRHTPILQWAGLPALAQVQRSALEKQADIGPREVNIPIAVSFAAVEGEVSEY